MRHQGTGVVCHPDFDRDLADNALARGDLVRQLRTNADGANTKGDAALLEQDWTESNRNWKYAARCIRASQAVSFRIPVNPDDYPIVGQAWRQVRQTPAETPDEWKARL